MIKIISFKDVVGGACWARFKTDTNEPCWISVAQDGVIVKKSNIGFFGAELYKEKNLYFVAKTAEAFLNFYTDDLTPDGIKNPVLKSFSNAILHCRDLSDVIHILNTAYKKN